MSGRTGEERGAEVNAGLIEDIFKSHYREFFSYSMFLVNDTDQAKDIIQEAFLYSFENMDSINSADSLIPYIKRTIHSKSINLLVRNRSLDKHHRAIFLNSDLYGSYDSIFSYLELKEIEDIISGAMEKLPEKSRKVFELSRFSGLTHDEIAKELGISYKTVEVHIYRVLKVMKKKLAVYRRPSS